MPLTRRARLAIPRGKRTGDEGDFASREPHVPQDTVRQFFQRVVGATGQRCIVENAFQPFDKPPDARDCAGGESGWVKNSVSHNKLHSKNLRLVMRVDARLASPARGRALKIAD